MFFSKLFHFLGRDLAMDLGTANTLLYTPREGIVLNEPSVVARDSREGFVLAVGREAKRYLGRTPEDINVVRPLQDGVIADFEVTRTMIASFIAKAIHRQRLVKPRTVICVPTGITQVEKRAVVEASYRAGAREVELIEEPMAAAIGAGLPIHEPVGNMVVDIGGGTTEVAVISLSAIAYSESVRVAGDKLDQAIVRLFLENYRMQIGETTAEKIKCSLGSPWSSSEYRTVSVHGLSLVHGIPQVLEVDEARIWEGIQEPLNTIIAAVTRALEKIPPELTADVATNGMLLAGGGAQMAGLSELISRQSQVHVMVDDNPLTTVLRGTGAALEARNRLREVFIT